MNCYEEGIKRLRKRIQRAEQDPDPSMLKTNNMLYELEINGLQAALEAWQAGKPIAMGVPVTTLFRAMGFTNSWRPIVAMQTNQASKYFDMLAAEGLPTNACDMASMPMAMAMSGDMPDESLLIGTDGICNPALLRSSAEAHLNGTPTFFLDMGFENNEETLEYVTNQLGELIEFAEWKVPGIKYSEDRLVEIEEVNRLFGECYKETYQALKNVPCPIGGKDVFRLPHAPSQYPDLDKALTYAKDRRDEVLERVEKGIGAVPNEELRMLWTVTGPYFMDPFKILADRGVVVPFYYGGVPYRFGPPMPIPTYWDGRKLSPLELEASRVLKMSWAGLGTRWVDGLIWVCRDLNIDAILNYCMLGCSATLGLKKLVEDTAESELGIPTLHIDGRQLEASYSDKIAIEAEIAEFVEIVKARNKQ